MKKITDYNTELDLNYNRMLYVSIGYLIFMLIATVVLGMYIVDIGKPLNYAVIWVPAPVWPFWVIYIRQQVVISMYLKDRNPDLYDKHKIKSYYMRGYGDLVNVSAKVPKREQAEITDVRVVKLINNYRLARVVVSICGILLMLLIILKEYMLF